MERLDLRHRPSGDVTSDGAEPEIRFDDLASIGEPKLPTIGPRGLDVLRERLELGTATVGVVGLGYVGLPLLVTAAQRGFAVIGVDADPNKIERLERGESYVVDVPDTAIRDLVHPRFTTSARALLTADVVIVAVPTPLRDGSPDLSLVLDAARSIAHVLRPGRLVVLESTTYPGTTEEVVLPVLENSGLKAGIDFALGYSPERIDPGSNRALSDVPKIVSGVGEEAGDLVELLYKRLGCPPVRAPAPRVAEMAKLIENTFRQVNIALVNELATVAADLDVDIWAALDAAATKPFGYMPFWPGPGVGGHCIAIDPSYLSWRATQRRGFGIGFVQHALEVNNSMPQYTAGRVGEALNEVGKPLKGSRVLALGVSYKGGVNDTRESPAIQVLDRLVRAGAICSYHDRFVDTVTIGATTLRSSPLTDPFLAEQDCVVVLTTDAMIDYDVIVQRAPLVFDAQGVTRTMHAANIVRL